MAGSVRVLVKAESSTASKNSLSSSSLWSWDAVSPGECGYNIKINASWIIQDGISINCRCYNVKCCKYEHEADCISARLEKWKMSLEYGPFFSVSLGITSMLAIINSIFSPKKVIVTYYANGRESIQGLLHTTSRVSSNFQAFPYHWFMAWENMLICIQSTCFGFGFKIVKRFLDFGPEDLKGQIDLKV